MLKKDFVNIVRANTGVTVDQAEQTVDAIFNSIANALSEGSTVRLHQVGTLTVIPTAERVGVNPNNTSERITIPAGKRVRFKASSVLKDII